MKRTTHFISLALMFFVGLSAWADQRSYTQAQKIAEAKAKSLGIVIDNTAKAKAKALHVAAAEKQSDAAYYVFPFGTGKGFAIVSGDDRMPEIVGYTDSGTFDEAHMSDGMKAYLQSYQAMAEAVKAGNKRALRTLEEYRLYKASGKQAIDAVSPLLGNITWDGYAPYNNYCPLYDGTNHSDVGCSAVAMAQVVAYWKYPASLQADIPAYTTSTSNISMPTILAGETYDWDNILPNYSNGYTEEQANAVAKLMLHCGASIGMDYYEASGAFMNGNALTKYFGYDADLIVEVSRSAVSIAKWTELIDNELKAKRPILMNGYQSATSGYAFVCDGSDGEGLYHINWGWSGYENGYFDVTVLNPEYEGVVSEDVADGYNRNMSMIIGIQPDNGVKDEPIIEVPGYQVCGEYNSDDPDKNYSLTITRGTRKAESESFELILNSCVYTLSHDETTFKVVYGISDGKGGYILLNGDSDFYTTMGIAMEDTIEFAPEPGTYTIYALYCEEGDTTWHKCSYDGNLSPFVVTATATELTLEKSGLTATFKPKNNLNGYERNTFEMTITNNSEYDFIGDVNVYYNTSNERPTDVTYNRYIPVAAHSSITRDITLQTTNSGPDDKIYVWVDAANEELISAEEFTIGAIAHPILRLVGVETNATPGEYETENAYYDGSRIKAPKINDDYMKVRYGIKNLGIEGKIRYKISAYDSNEFNFYEKDKGYQTISLPADSSEVYYLEETWTPEEMNGARTILTTLYLRLFDSDTKPTVRIADDIRYTYIDLIDEGSKLELKIEWPVCYVAGKPAGIDNIKIADGVTIAASKGEIVVRADKAESLTVYSVDGRLVTQVSIEAGSEMSICLPTGVYVVNGQKVVVR